ncbi:MAG TPA: glycosyltransferase family 1 protein [bacterium]|nr:glycosyltransferase family 1 protein [bacterium]HPT29597.1 glycosyltransferase family 1 protein [bacterium]
MAGKRIGIDARFYGPLGKGLGRYVQELVDNAINIDTDNEYIIFLSRDNFDELIIPPEAIGRVKKVMAPIRWYGWKEQVVLPFYFWRAKLDLLHVPHFNVSFFLPCPLVVTVHDLILTKFPTQRASTLSPILYRLKNLAYRQIIASALRRARQVITVSNFTKQDIIEQFKIAPEKIVVTYEGVANLARGHDSLFVQKIDAGTALQKYHIPANFLLYIGNAYPHKNLEGLLRAFKKLQEDYPQLSLVLVGKPDYFYERVQAYAQELGLSGVIFPGYVPDQELELLYEKARAYIFPSFYEGFGLPPLEAMAKNCPVLSSDQSSLPEILGEAALYFDPRNIADMVKQAKLILSDEKLRQDLIARGRERVKLYSWWNCAYQTVQVYQKILYGQKTS